MKKAAIKICDLLKDKSDWKKILKTVDKAGSISKAAECLGISYKTAWGYAKYANSLFKEDIIITERGGINKGKSYLTKNGKALIKMIEDLERSFERFWSYLEKYSMEEDLSQILNRRYIVRTSARNQFVGKVIKLRPQGLNLSIYVRISEKEIINAIITKKSGENLKISKDEQVFLLIKAPQIIVVHNEKPIKNTENILKAKVEKIEEKGGRIEVSLKTKSGSLFVSLLPIRYFKNLKIRRGDNVKITFKASSVILGI